MNFIRLATPTTDDKRLPKVAAEHVWLVYYVSITGITGAAEAQATDVGPEVARIKSQTDLPVIVGFGIKTPTRRRRLPAWPMAALWARPSWRNWPAASL